MEAGGVWLGGLVLSRRKKGRRWSEVKGSHVVMGYGRNVFFFLGESSVVCVVLEWMRFQLFFPPLVHSACWTRGIDLRLISWPYIEVGPI